MKKIINFTAAIASIFVLFSACSNGSNDKYIPVYIPNETPGETTEPMNVSSYTVSIYDKTNFSDYKEVRSYGSGGLVPQNVEFFFYSASEVAECPLSDSIKEGLVQNLNGLSYDKETESGKYVSILCSIEGTQYKPVEKNFYSKSSAGIPRKLVVSYDYDASGNLETVPSNIIFDGLVETVNGTSISYRAGSAGSVPAQYKEVRIDFDPSEGNKVTFYRVSEFDTDHLIGGYSIKDTEYNTTGLTCTASAINSSTSLENDFDFTLNKIPELSYCNEVPLDKCSADKKEWYQVNRTINFFTDSGEISKTLHRLYKMSWDTNVLSNYFILQTEYNTDGNFEAAGERVKSVSVVPAAKDRIRAYLYVYGETTQHKKSFSYSNYPALSDSENPKAALYNSRYGNEFYTCKEDNYERVSEKSLDLTKKSYATSYFYFTDGALCQQVIEYSLTAESDSASSSPQIEGATDFTSDSSSARRLLF